MLKVFVIIGDRSSFPDGVMMNKSKFGFSRFQKTRKHVRELKLPAPRPSES